MPYHISITFEKEDAPTAEKAVRNIVRYLKDSAQECVYQVIDCETGQQSAIDAYDLESEEEEQSNG